VRFAVAWGLNLRGRCVRHVAGFYADEATLTTAHELGLRWSATVMKAAAQAGHLPELKMIHAARVRDKVRDGRLPKNIINDAALSGNVEMLNWLTFNDCKCAVATSYNAAVNGHLDAVKYLFSIGCRCDYSTANAAAANGSLSVLKFVTESGCGWSGTQVAHTAAFNNDIAMLQYAKVQGTRFAEGTMHGAAAGGLAACEYLLEQGCEFDARACCAAARHNRVDTLRWLRERGCPWDPYDVCSEAASAGQVDVLQYVYEQQDVELTADEQEELLCAAGETGHLPAAKFLRQHGAQWPEHVFGWKRSVLKWAAEQGCIPAEALWRVLADTSSSDDDSSSDSDSDSGSDSDCSDEDYSDGPEPPRRGKLLSCRYIPLIVRTVHRCF
jgi:hypothetical protein